MPDPDEPSSLDSRTLHGASTGEPGSKSPAPSAAPLDSESPAPSAAPLDPGLGGTEPGTGEPGPYQSLYRRFRPQQFSEVLGQDHVVVPLRRAVHHATVTHAYLFSGPRGTGKTSTARILAKALNCTGLVDGEPCGRCSSCVEIARGTSLDVHELDAASNNGVDAMRELVSRAALGTPGRTKVYIVDEVHMLSTAASNALLKTLEEPPGHVVFVLATTDPQKVLPTIRSRTQHFEFRLLGPDVLVDLLRQVRDHARLGLDDQAVDVAVRRGRGSARDALSVLDQVAAGGIVDDDSSVIGDLAESLAGRDPAQVLAAVSRAIGAGYDPQRLATELADHLRQAFLMVMAPDLVTVPDADRRRAGSLGESMGLAAVVRGMERLGVAQVAMRDAPDPRAHLEVALVRLAVPELDDSVSALLERVDRLERRLGASGATPTSAPSSPAAPTSAPSSPAAPTSTPSSPAAPTSTPSTPLPRRAASPAEPASDRISSVVPPPSASSAPVSSSEPLQAQMRGPELARRTLGAVRRQQASASSPPTASSPGVSGTGGSTPGSQGGSTPGSQGGPASDAQRGPASDAQRGSAPGSQRGPASDAQRGSAPVSTGGDPASDAQGGSTPGSQGGAASDAQRGSAPGSTGGDRLVAGREEVLAGREEVLAGREEVLPSREELVQAWGDHVLSALPSRARARFRVGRFLAVEDGSAVFALPNDTHRSYCEEVRLDVEAALGAHFGRRVPLRLVVDVDPLDQRPPPAAGASGPPSLAPPPGSDRVADATPRGSRAPASEAPPSDPTDYQELLDVDVLQAETRPAGSALSPEQRLRQAFPGAEEV